MLNEQVNEARAAVPSREPTVLLVDDREENLAALEAALRPLGCGLLLAGSGREALEMLLRADVALALVDVRMPDMDGFEVAELMRGAERTRSIPIIFVTAAPDDQARIFEGYESGAVDFLLKPVDARVLRSKVLVFLELDRQRRQLAERVRDLLAAQERLREADRRKDEFIAILSHELRNPLTPLHVGVHLLRSAAPGSPQASRAVDAIERQATHLARLVDDLLDVTRVTRGKVRLNRESADLVGIVRHCLEDHRAIFARAGITLYTDLHAGPLRVHADTTRIAQITGNILGNAAKFTPPGGRVWVALRADGDRAVLSVKDDGAGISPELLGRLFEPFAQADRTLDRSRGGLGLGLALVRALTEMHGGTVAARSDGPGQGAEILVRLPLERPAGG